MGRTSWSGLAVVAVIATGLGCSADTGWPGPSDDVVLFAGELEGTDALLSLALAADGTIEAYMCGGDATFRTHSHWFCGGSTLAGEERLLSLRDGGWLLEASIVGDEVVGEIISLTDPPIPVRIHRVPLGSKNGLYFADSDGCRTGVVVWDPVDGPPRAQGAYCDEWGVAGQVTPVRPVEDWAEVPTTLKVDADGAPLRVYHVAP